MATPSRCAAPRPRRPRPIVIGQACKFDYSGTQACKALAEEGYEQEHHQQHSSPHGHHFLVVAYGTQSHVNPGRALAHRLARLSHIDARSIRATLSVLVAAQRRLFPTPDSGGDKELACSDGVISYVPHSDGFDDGATSPKTAAEPGAMAQMGMGASAEAAAGVRIQARTERMVLWLGDARRDFVDVAVPSMARRRMTGFR
jgi:hypothetical protein